MSSVLRSSFGALCLAFVISMGLLSAQSSSAADRDESYLPPSMHNDAAAPMKGSEKADPPKIQHREEVQPAKAEAQQGKTKESSSASLPAKATQAKAGVVGFVSNFFSRTVRFAKGD